MDEKACRRHATTINYLTSETWIFILPPLEEGVAFFDSVCHVFSVLVKLSTHKVWWFRKCYKLVLVFFLLNADSPSLKFLTWNDLRSRNFFFLPYQKKFVLLQQHTYLASRQISALKVSLFFAHTRSQTCPNSSVIYFRDPPKPW